MIQLVDNNQPVLDEHGNVVGGVRSPYVDVPTSTWFGNATGASFCFIAGYEVPFSQAKLATLYPTKADYVAKVTASVRSLVAQRYLTEADGRDIIQEANFACTPGPVTDPRLPICWTDADGDVSGTVPATLSLTLGPNVNFGAFTPGVTKRVHGVDHGERDLDAGDATLSRQRPERDRDRPSRQRRVLAARAAARGRVGAAGHGQDLLRADQQRPRDDRVRQLVKSTDALRTGTYSKTLTFTLSTTTP